MITNERQYRISKAQLERFRTAVGSFQAEVGRATSPILAQAELAALQSQFDDLAEQIREFEALQSGAVSVLKAQSLTELPRLLIKARIARGLSQRKLAEVLGLKEQQIQRYEAEDYATANLRRLAEVAQALNLNISEVAEFKQSRPARKESPNDKLDWERFPIAEMYKRNWFAGYDGSRAEAMAEGKLLMGALLASAGKQPQLALHRKRVRSGSEADPYALLAWQCRVLSLANQAQIKAVYSPEKLDEGWLKKLVQLSRFPDGPVRASKFVEDAGIALIIEPHLSSTHLDGAAMLGDRGPVVGLTLRFDRLDNFWFVLLHELAHVIKHLKKGRLEDIFDDLEAEADELEREADDLAGEALISDSYWETALARYLRTENSVRACAEELKISEAIVAGRIRKEADNYIIFNEQVGLGQVRKLFPAIKFGQ
jgi:HTH-type transcriptional regulator/antitoxin HigA